MKRLLSTLLLLHLLNLASAQNTILSLFEGPEEKGDKQAWQFSYSEAIASYKVALEKDRNNDHIKLKIAESYRMLNDPKNAVEWYNMVIHNDDVAQPEHYHHYAEMLSSTGKYEEAKQWYARYEGNSSDGVLMVRRKIETIDNFHVLFADSALYEINKAPINTAYADFSPAFYNEGLVFVSSRPGKKNKKIDFNWDQTKFLELYYAPESEEGFVEKPRPFHQKINTKYHEGPVAFFDDGNKMIFTRNNYLGGKYGESSDGINKLKLYYSEKKDDAWQKPMSLPFNDDNYSVGHPTVSSDGKILIFSSDMPGSLGNTDLFISRYQDGEWSKPENMGKKINTMGKELFPYLYDDHVLFFASNGHAGMGGLDIYEIDLEQIGSAEVKNLGHPINSRMDDFGLVLDEEMTHGYFSSNRANRPSDDDIYQLVFRTFMGEIIVMDGDSKEPLSDVAVSLKKDKGSHTLYHSDISGKVSGLLAPQKEYLMSFHKNGYEDTSLENYTADQANFPLTVYLYKEDGMRLVPDVEEEEELIASVSTEEQRPEDLLNPITEDKRPESDENTTPENGPVNVENVPENQEQELAAKNNPADASEVMSEENDQPDPEENNVPGNNFSDSQNENATALSAEDPVKSPVDEGPKGIQDTPSSGDPSNGEVVPEEEQSVAKNKPENTNSELPEEQEKDLIAENNLTAPENGSPVENNLPSNQEDPTADNKSGSLATFSDSNTPPDTSPTGGPETEDKQETNPVAGEGLVATSGDPNAVDNVTGEEPAGNNLTEGKMTPGVNNSTAESGNTPENSPSVEESIAATTEPSNDANKPLGNPVDESPVVKREITYAEARNYIATKKVMDRFKTVPLEIIYYDFNEHFIRADAEEILKEVAEAMIKNPKIKVLIRSHTDVRGTEGYNQRLSLRRAIAAMNYLLNYEEIDKDRIYIKHFGESILAELCNGGTDCTEDQHQLNRRSEITVMVDK